MDEWRFNPYLLNGSGNYQGNITTSGTSIEIYPNSVAYVPPPPQTAVDWLRSQVEETCALARAA